MAPTEGMVAKPERQWGCPQNPLSYLTRTTWPQSNTSMNWHKWNDANIEVIYCTGSDSDVGLSHDLPDVDTSSHVELSARRCVSVEHGSLSTATGF